MHDPETAAGQTRQREAGVSIDYGFFETPLGGVLLAATPRGLCALRLCHRSSQQQLDEVQADFAAAAFTDNPGAVQAYADPLVAFLEARTENFCPALDLMQGTTFQREVWAELQKVRPGETISYTDLAQRVGRPAAVRAAGGACARNSLAIAIPCHRACRLDGTLAGFRWGGEWKQRLLEIEARISRRAG